MKILVPNYTFSAAAKQITFTDYASIVLERVLIITNVTDNIVIYQFNSATKGGTVATNVLTLTYDTTAMSDTDDLQIFYEDDAFDNVLYTEGDTDASITGRAILMEGAADTLLPVQGTVADGLLVNLGANNDITGTVTANAGTDLNTSALALETTASSIKTAVELIDNAVSGAGFNITQLAGAAVPIGAGLEATAVRVTLPTDGTGRVGITAASGAIAAGAIAAGATSIATTEDTARAAGEHLVKVGISRLDTPVANANVGTDGDYTNIIADNFGKVWVSGTAPEDTAHVAGEAITLEGSRRIDTLATSTGASGDWGTVNQTAEGAGWVTVAPTTTSGLSVKNCTSGDTYTALTNSAQAVKASAGLLYGWFIMNPNAAAAYVNIYDIASGSVTVGTSTALMNLCIPAGAAANFLAPIGITFGTAISVSATTTGGGNTAPTTALEAMFFYK